jgi:multiple sugar transport system substrate-binding protein
VEKWQSGGVADLKAGLTAVDKQNNAALKLGQ